LKQCTQIQRRCTLPKRSEFICLIPRRKKLRNSIRSQAFQKSDSDDSKTHGTRAVREDRNFRLESASGRSLPTGLPASKNDNLITDSDIKPDKYSKSNVPEKGTITITKSYSTQSISMKNSDSSAVSATAAPSEVLLELQPTKETMYTESTTPELDVTTINGMAETTADLEHYTTTMETPGDESELNHNIEVNQENRKIAGPSSNTEYNDDYLEAGIGSVTALPEDNQDVTVETVVPKVSTQKDADSAYDEEEELEIEGSTTEPPSGPTATSELDDGSLLEIAALARVTSQLLPAETRDSSGVQLGPENDKAVQEGEKRVQVDIKFRFPKDSAEETVIEENAELTTVKPVAGEKRQSIVREKPQGEVIRERQKLRKRPVGTKEETEEDDSMISDHGITSRQPPGRGQALWKRPDMEEKTNIESPVLSTSSLSSGLPASSASTVTTKTSPAPTPAPTPTPPPPPTPAPAPAPAPTIKRGVNACPVEADVVAPYWANNTRGEVLALLNLAPFEQYVHWEKCKFEYRQMYCRPGCRCEQQYRLHRMLAFDPQDDCRGIFSDWFRFPSGCVCMCYDLDEAPPVQYVTHYKRRPRVGAMDSVKDSSAREAQFDREQERNPNDLTDVFFMEEEDIEIPETDASLQDSEDSETILEDGSNNLNLNEMTRPHSLKVPLERSALKYRKEVPAIDRPEPRENILEIQTIGEDEDKLQRVPAPEPFVFQSRRLESEPVPVLAHVGPTGVLQQVMNTIDTIRSLKKYPTSSNHMYNIRYSQPRSYVKYMNPSQMSQYRRVGYQNMNGRGSRRYSSSMRRLRSFNGDGNWNPQASFPQSLSNPNFNKYSRNSLKRVEHDSKNLNYNELTRSRSVKMSPERSAQEYRHEVPALDAQEPQYYFNLTSHLIRSRKLDSSGA